MGSALEALTADYQRQIDENRAMAEGYARAALEEGRELSDQEQATLDRLFTRNQTLGTNIERTVRDYGLAQDAQDKLKVVAARTSQPDVQYRSAGHLLHDMLHANKDTEARERYDRYMRACGAYSRAAEHLGYDKANTVPTAGGFNGLTIVSGVGAVLDPYPSGRPLFTALGPTTVPGMEFKRPRIIDPNFLTGVAERTQEKAEAVSKTWDISSENVVLTLYSGYVNVSELLIEMIPAGLDMVITHMNRRLAAVTEGALIAEIDTTTAIVTVTGDAIFDALGQAAADVFAATGQWPNWIAMGGAGAAKLVGATDAAGRQLWPFIGPSNAGGTSSLTGGPSSVGGLTPILSRQITDDSLYVGSSMFGVEVYERQFGVMQALEPSLFGRQISVNAAVGFYNPITTEGATPVRASVVKITWGP